MDSLAPMSQAKINRRVGWIYLFLALVTIALYWPVTGFEFVNFDDDLYVTANPHSQSGVTVKGILWAFSNCYSYNWQPLAWLSHMLDCELYGMYAGGHHVSSVLIHVANTLLLFGLLRRMTGATWRSAFVAALFAWHPMHVESVAWVSERKDVLSTFFAFLTFWAYSYYVQNPNWRRYVLALISFALGLMSKPMLVSLPLLLLLFDYWPLRRSEAKLTKSKKKDQAGFKVWTRLVVEKAPFFLLAFILSCITYWAQLIKPGQATGHFTLGERVANALNSYVGYICKLAWPLDLAVFYPYRHHLPLGQVLGAAILLAVISALAFHWRRSRPYILFGWFWYVITLVPVIGFIQVGEQSMADRYTYITSIGLFVVIAWETSWLLEQRTRAIRIAVGFSVLLGLAGFCVLTSHQLQYWRNSVALFTHALKVTRNNALAHASLGAALVARGDQKEALAHFEEALRINPNSYIARNDRGELLLEQGKIEEATADLREALRLKPDSDAAHCNLGKALVAQRKWEEAGVEFKTAVKCNPESASDLTNLGLFLARQGKIEEAISQYRAALKLAQEPSTENALGSALESQGKADEASVHYLAAVKLKPDFAEGHCNLGSILLEQGKVDEAINHFKTAIILQPDFAPAHFNLGNALVNRRELDEAAGQYQTAVTLQPGYMEAHFNLGNVLFEQKQWASALSEFAATGRLRSDFAAPEIRMAQVLVIMGNTREGMAHYKKALKLDSGAVPALNGLAWILATNPDPDLRNGSEAIRLANAATRLNGADSSSWDTLAAACAEAGRFADAVSIANKAIIVANTANQKELAGEIKKRLLLYEAGHVFHAETTQTNAKTQ